MKKSTKSISIGAMVCALSVLFLYASETLSYVRFLALFFGAFIMYIPVRESLYGCAWLSFTATVLISFFLLPARLAWFFYVALLGHYAIVRRIIYDNVNYGWLKSLLMLLYSNAGVAIGLYLLYRFVEVSPLSLLPEQVPLTLCIILLELAFLVIDLLFGIFTRVYDKRLRPLLMHN